MTYEWSFPDGVRVGTGTPTRNDDFSVITSNAGNPIVAWDVPGNKTVSLTVTDDDGSQATAVLAVVVLNQMPVATFDVRTLSPTGSREIDFKKRMVKLTRPMSLTDLTAWTLTARLVIPQTSRFGIGPSPMAHLATVRKATHTFTTPGVHTVTLVVTDKDGEESSPHHDRPDFKPATDYPSSNFGWLP